MQNNHEQALVMNKHAPLPPQEILKEFFEYSFIEGALYWKKRPSPKAKLWLPAGSKDSEGYVSITFRGKAYRRHRLIWAYFYEDPADFEIDHINRVKGDDKIENLRTATRRQNSCNIIYSTNKSGAHGVCWHKRDKKWRASIRKNGVNLHLGYFDSLKKAEQVYLEASKKIHSDFSVSLSTQFSQ